MSPTPALSTIFGTVGNDDLSGTAGPDRMHGLSGDDIIRGLAGSDALWGQAGEDLLLGRAGDDYLSGGPGADIANGGSGADMAAGWAGNDILLGRDGEDWLIGHDNDDFLDDGPGDDRHDGGPGNDALFGRSGDDRLLGGPGDDHLVGDGSPDPEPIATLVGPEPEPGTDPFWQAFALGDEVLAALTPGAPEITLHDADTGAVTGTLQPPAGVGAFGIGTTLAAGGDRILVGEPDADAGAEDSGRSHLYDADGNFIATLQPPEPLTQAVFGVEAAVSAEVIAVAETTYPGKNVHLFDPETGAYRTTVEFPGGPNLQVNSVSLAADGGTIAMVVNYSGFGSTPSFAEVYLYDAWTGALKQTIAAPNESQQYFAYDVAIDGDRVLVGSPNEDTIGRAYLFDADSGDLITTIENPAPSPGHNVFFPGNFGGAVALTEDRILVGDLGSEVAAETGRGAVYIFDHQGENLLQILSEPDPANGNGFGEEIAARGDNMAVLATGARQGPVPGAIYLYRDEKDAAGGKDFLNGGDGVDVLQGGGGNDQLYGGGGADVVEGGAGADWISGGPGSDMLSGGPGTDGFVLRGDEGRDIITDFEDGDHLVFRDAGVQGPAEVDVTEADGNAVVGFGANSVTLQSISTADIQNDWFIFA